MSEVQLGLKVNARTKAAIETAARAWGVSQAAALGEMVSPLSDRTVLTLFGPQPERITQALDAWCGQLSRATHEVSQALSRAEWNYLADVCNGLLLTPGTDNPAPTLALEAHDGHRLNHLGNKWFPAGRKADAAVASLVERVAAMTPLHAWAVAVAIRWFWDHSQLQFDHQVVEWWSLPFRRSVAEGESCAQ